MDGAYNATGSTSPITLSNYWIFAYQNFLAGSYADWQYIGQNGALPVGLSFTMKGSGVGHPITDYQNYTFVGKPNNGTITNPITAGNEALVGNPYPSAIDANQFIIENGPSGANSISGTLYFWEHYTSNNTHILEEYEGGYAALNLLGGNPAVSHPDVSQNGSPTKTPGRYIPVAQGFYVGSSNSGGNVTFNNSQRTFIRETSPNSTFIRSNNQNLYNSNRNNNNEDNSIKRIRLECKTTEGAIRSLLLGFTNNNIATNGVDYGYDAINLDNYENDASFMINNEKYTIQGVGSFNVDQQFPLGIFLSNQGNVEVSLKSIENFDSEIDVYIYDSLLNTYSAINTTSFNINLDAQDYVDRFYLTFNTEDTLSNTELDNNNIFVNYLNQSNEVYIKSSINIIKEVVLVNILGQNIISWDFENEYNSEIRLPIKSISEGTYVVKVITNTGIISKKIIIKY